jgi:hypothetical protein
VINSNSTLKLNIELARLKSCYSDIQLVGDIFAKMDQKRKIFDEMLEVFQPGQKIMTIDSGLNLNQGVIVDKDKYNLIIIDQSDQKKYRVNPFQVKIISL